MGRSRPTGAGDVSAAVVAGLAAAVLALLSGLLVVVVAPVVGLTGLSLVVQRGRTRWVGGGMLVGTLVPVLAVGLGRVLGGG